MPTDGVAGILLTGGSARRLGVAKAGLRFRGETLGARGARVLRAVCIGPVLEAGPGASGLPSVREHPPGSGPLAALAAAGAELRARGHRGGALLLAVDLPLVDEGLLRLLAEWRGEPTVVPEASGRLQVACSRYGPDALLAAESLVMAGVRALRALLDVTEYDVVAEPVWHEVAGADAFADVNTPSDAARFGIALPDG